MEWDLYAGTSTAYTDMTRKIENHNYRMIPGPLPRHIIIPPPRLLIPRIPDGNDSNNDTPVAETVKVPAGITTTGFHHRTKGSFKVDSFQILKPVSTGITGDGKKKGLSPDASDILVLDMTGRVIASFPDADGYNTATFDKGLYVVRFTVCRNPQKRQDQRCEICNPHSGKNSHLGR